MEEVKRNEIGCRINVYGHNNLASDIPTPATLFKDGTIIPMEKILVETIEHTEYIEGVFDWKHNLEGAFRIRQVN